MLAVLQDYVGGCREELGNGKKCGATSEYVLWGELTPIEGLGPRCFDCAAKHVNHYGLAPRSGWALIRLADLAYDVTVEARAEAERPRAALREIADHSASIEAEDIEYFARKALGEEA